MKRFSIAFFLLLFGGVFGLHHFYLGRIRHGILYMFTFGLYGAGALYDFTRLRFYVRWANFDEGFKEEYLTRIRQDPKPSLSSARMLTLLLLPQMFGTVIRYALPQEVLNPYVHVVLTSIVMPLAQTFVVWFVCNIGEYQAEFRDALITAYYVSPLYFIFTTSPYVDMLTALMAFYAIRKTWRYRLKPEEPRSFMQSFGLVLTFFTAFTVLFICMVMFSCSIQVEGEEVTCREALRHFFTSPLWQDILTSLRSIKNSIKEGGWESFRQNLVLLMDPTGELHAYKVLGVNETTSDEDIRKAYRQLSKQYHPDKNLGKDSEEVEEAEYKFIEVQQAFETLQLKRSKNGKLDTDDLEKSQ